MQDRPSAEELVRAVKEHLEREVIPVASTLEHRNEYPQQLVDRMNGRCAWSTTAR